MKKKTLNLKLLWNKQPYVGRDVKVEEAEMIIQV